MTKTRDLLYMLILGMKKVHANMAFCAPVHRRCDYQDTFRLNRHG